MNPETIKRAVECGWSKVNDEVLEYRLKDNEKGFTYRKLLTPFVTDELKKATIVDPYLCSNTHISNFSDILNVLFELANPSNFLFLTLRTSRPDKPKEREKYDIFIDELNKQFGRKEFNWENKKIFTISFNVDQQNTLHDREIILENIDSSDFEITLGRGLDIFGTRLDYNNTITDEEWKEQANRPCRGTKIVCYSRSASTILVQSRRLEEDAILTMAGILAEHNGAVTNKDIFAGKLGVPGGKIAEFDGNFGRNAWRFFHEVLQYHIQVKVDEATVGSVVKVLNAMKLNDIAKKIQDEL